jgi:chemotaxis protein MotB
MDKKPDACKAGAPEWMVTYGDLVTLLMCFFVLLFAFSEIDAQKFEAVMESFQGSAGVLESGKSLSEDELVFDASPENDTTPDTTQTEELEIIENILQDMVAKLEDELSGSDLSSEIKFELQENRLIIKLPNSVLFDPAKAELKDESFGVLSILGEALQDEIFAMGNLRIEGHTDNVPINTIRFPSNWELSAARATSVLRYFRDELSFTEDRFAISGYSDTRPMLSNDTPEGRAANRRVEIIVEDIDIGISNEVETTGSEGE